jgi:hypothetical protein
MRIQALLWALEQFDSASAELADLRATADGECTSDQAVVKLI